MTDKINDRAALTAECKRLAERMADQYRYAYEHGGGHGGHLANAGATQRNLLAAIDALAAALAQPTLTNKQIERAVYERTKLNPNQRADQELLNGIVLAMRDLLAALSQQGERHE